MHTAQVVQGQKAPQETKNRVFVLIDPNPNLRQV